MLNVLCSKNVLITFYVLTTSGDHIEKKISQTIYYIFPRLIFNSCSIQNKISQTFFTAYFLHERYKRFSREPGSAHIYFEELVKNLISVGSMANITSV